MTTNIHFLNASAGHATCDKRVNIKNVTPYTILTTCPTCKRSKLFQAAVEAERVANVKTSRVGHHNGGKVLNPKADRRFARNKGLPSRTRKDRRLAREAAKAAALKAASKPARAKKATLKVA